MTTAAGDHYALNLSLPPLRGQPLAPRILAAASAGFSLVETWWPFSTGRPARPQTEELRTALTSAGTQLVCMNIDAGDYASGERGILSDPGRQQACRSSIVTAVEFASEVGCRLINLPYGNRLPHLREEEQHQTALDNLLFAAKHADSHGISVLVEALNSLDNPGYLLTDLDVAADIVFRTRQAGCLNTGLLLDVYHVARMGQDPVEAIRRHAQSLRHVQFADAPGRTCPGTGDLDFARIVAALRDVEYGGLIGLEFNSRPGHRHTPVDARSFAARHPLAGDTVG
ncbi:hydroxypyruvate isomerase family protein [Streptomyces sp. NPDC059455]|uniref:hydroxypyruvate isomerase family protein n=1 Tax=Streptomyces sp. NPDC059455 TaxID=3346837 RepID=UPI0036C68F50